MLNCLGLYCIVMVCVLCCVVWCYVVLRCIALSLRFYNNNNENISSLVRVVLALCCVVRRVG